MLEDDSAMGKKGVEQVKELGRAVGKGLSAGWKEGADCII